jgi:hypothetical protein
MSMRFKSLTLVFTFFLLSHSNYATELAAGGANIMARKPAHSARHALAIDMTNFFFGGIGVRYEYSPLPYFNLTFPLEGQLLLLSAVPPEIVAASRLLSWSFFPDLVAQAGIGAKFHYAGWYIEPLAKIGVAQVQFPDSMLGTRTYALIKPEVLVGYQTVFDFGMFINVGLGFGWRFFVPSTDIPPIWQPDAILALGYAW